MPDFAFCSGVLIKAFVWQVSVPGDEVLVTPNYDVENNEPARLDVQRVRANANGALGRVRTCGLLLRRQTLYPTELLGRIHQLYATIARMGPKKKRV